MKKFNCSFYRPEKTDIREFDDIVRKLEEDLDQICEEKIESPEIYSYAFCLAMQARPLTYKPEMAFLGLDDPNKMPSDAREDFFYMPTYIGTAILFKAILLEPALWEENGEDGLSFSGEDQRRLKEMLPLLMNGCTGRGFSGHGYDGLEGMIRALTVFVEADTETFLEKYPQISPAFTALYRESLEMLEKRLAKGALVNAWGEDYSAPVQDLLAMRDGRRQAAAPDQENAAR